MAFKNVSDMSKCVRLFVPTECCSLAAYVLCTLFPLTKTNAAFEICTSHFAGLDFCSKNMQHEPHKSVYMGKEFNSPRIALVHQHVLGFIVNQFRK